ncbi:hypothetical protein [Bacteroidaceae bacterium]|jgi:hypothetical protein
MKTCIYILAVAMCFCIFFSCGGNNKGTRSFDGTFYTETGAKFELKPDSTYIVQFNDSLNYEGSWSVHRTETNGEYVNIEFAGYLQYYYLKNNKLYYSERDMKNDKLGISITYTE